MFRVAVLRISLENDRCFSFDSKTYDERLTVIVLRRHSRFRRQSHRSYVYEQLFSGL